MVGVPGATPGQALSPLVPSFYTELSTEAVDYRAASSLAALRGIHPTLSQYPPSATMRPLLSPPRTVPAYIDLPYPSDCAALFAPLARQPWAHWLDSSNGCGHDFITALPRTTLVTRGANSEIRHADGRSESSSAAPLELLRRELGPLRPSAETLFYGGALGYFGYDLARRIHRLPSLAADPEGLPEMAVGIYDGALALDHQARTCRLWHDNPEWARRFLALLEGAAPPLDFQLAGRLDVQPDPAAYRRAFDQVQRYIRAGDCYQVNLALRYSAPCVGQPWPLYLALRRSNPAPFAAWLHFPFGQVLSSSPERFLQVHDGVAETRPIKGTRPRSEDPARDAMQQAELAASAKDRAENLMIVDLLRNDLGRVCTPGGVSVPELFAVESFAAVHHLVSTVRGQLAPGRTALDLLAAAFPGGSITGAPKQRAMEIIEQLEPERRGVYCGAIGYLGYDGNLDSNIAIRSLTCVDGILRFSAGGGLVADSDADAEYRECNDKARALLQALEGFVPGTQAAQP